AGGAIANSGEMRLAVSRDQRKLKPVCNNLPTMSCQALGWIPDPLGLTPLANMAAAGSLSVAACEARERSTGSRCNGRFITFLLSQVSKKITTDFTITRPKVPPGRAERPW